MLDILIDRTFISNKQHQPISLKYSLWLGCLGNTAMWKKEILSLKEFSYFETWLLSEASPTCKKKGGPDSVSATEITYWLSNSPEIANATAIFLADC